MNIKRLWAMFIARNKEFIRDRSALGWNFLFPILIVFGFGLIFNGNEYNEFKVGIFPLSAKNFLVEDISIPETFRQTRYIKFIPIDSKENGLDKLRHHKIDLLLKIDSIQNPYWISSTSPKGYIAEKLYIASLKDSSTSDLPEKKEIKGEEIRYIEWMFPGILGMNMMFSALWGVGYIIVRYRKNGVLKRLKATPVTAFEYLTAQMLSRIFLMMFTLALVFAGCDAIFSFTVRGSLFDLSLTFFIGGLSLISLGLIIASRGTSEEFTSGLLNFITWPMMFLSEVWFSIEGAPKWIRVFSEILPLTHMLRAARKIMNDGAVLSEVSYELGILCIMTITFLVIGAAMFSWNK